MDSMNSEAVVSYMKAAKDGVDLLRRLVPPKKKEEPPPVKPPDLSEDIRRLREDLMASGATESLKTAPILENPTRGRVLSPAPAWTPSGWRGRIPLSAGSSGSWKATSKMGV